MGNEEKARELAIRLIGGGDRNIQPLVDTLIEMAEWKDEQPKEINCGKVLQLRRGAYKKGYDKAIEKACEWLKENLTLYVSVEPKGWEGYKLLIEEEELTTELKKAMELKP